MSVGLSRYGTIVRSCGHREQVDFLRKAAGESDESYLAFQRQFRCARCLAKSVASRRAERRQHPT